MLPRETLAVAQIADGGELSLVSHGRDFIIMLGRDELMGTRMQYSEEQLAVQTMERVENDAPRILIGGYGMGFTLRAALARMGPNGQAVVAELVPEVVEWAQGPMSELTGDSLDDPRLDLKICDVAALIDDANDGTCDKFDAILLDVDNGPDGIVREENNRLYSPTGLGRSRDALKPGGMLAVWSAGPDHRFTRKLRDAGFDVEERFFRARPNNKGPRHTIWFARPRQR
uniref:spermidine synthase n=1 Tax=uncultured Altererythrobacter sp. TaxID=500840 RepID=UPI002626DDB4|nr:spermidine synthase [uncultured Altererythrobacter sp.]